MYVTCTVCDKWALVHTLAAQYLPLDYWQQMNNVTEGSKV